jgi:hypothetical protein
MHVNPQWVNRHLLLPLIDNKGGEPKMTPRLVTLVKWVVELCDTGLQVCHCSEDFTLWRIRPLDHREKLAYECPRLDDPSHDPDVIKIFNSTYCC